MGLLPGGRCLCGCAVLNAAIGVLLALAGGAYLQELEVFRTKGPGARWVNWIGEFGCGAGVAIERPATVAELQAAVQKHTSVRAAATGHSFNAFACPSSANGAVVDMLAFRKVSVSKLEGGAGYAVTAEAGIKMGQLQNEILAHGLTLRVPPGNPAYTLGGCVATGCHNLGQSHAQDLLALTLVQHNGTIRKVHRGEPDFEAAAVSMGRMGVILDATLEVLPYRSLQWAAEQLPMPGMREVIDIMENMTKSQTSREMVGNKLVFYLATGVLMLEHWIPLGRTTEPQPTDSPLEPYINSQPFRVGQGPLTKAHAEVRRAIFESAPGWLLNILQVPAEMAFRGLHASPLLLGVRKALGWQHSPEARGEGTQRPTGHQYTWAGFVDEVVNLLMGLRHVEVIFPLEPKDKAERCLEVVFAHKHLAWWRLNVRTMKSESYHLSSTHAPAGAPPVVFFRVDFVSPGALLELPSGEASLTKRLHSECPGWRKHWGKGLFTTSAEERWGDAEAFREVVSRWDPAGKFRPQDAPSWLP